MTTLAPNGLSLEAVAERKDPNGDMAAIVDALAEENGIIPDAVWMEANDTFSHKTTRRSNEPAGAWRKLNAGADIEKSEVTNVTDGIGLLETWAENDVEVINAFPNPIQARNDEAMSFVKGLSKTMTSTIVYGNTILTPEQFRGLAPRLGSLSGTTNVINEGGTGSDLTSIFVVDWGLTTCHMLYPKNSKMGLEHQDKGIQTISPSTTTKYDAYVDKFVWKAGLAVKNLKSIGRVANIESSGTTNIFDEDNLITLLNRMTKSPGRRIYVNETVMTQMEIRLKDKSNVNLDKMDGLAPGLNLSFKGVPVRQVDQIINTEAALT